jgi:hypothetical protein
MLFNKQLIIFATSYRGIVLFNLKYFVHCYVQMIQLMSDNYFVLNFRLSFSFMKQERMRKFGCSLEFKMLNEKKPYSSYRSKVFFEHVILYRKSLFRFAINFV